MLSYILRRILLMIPTLLGITLVVFITMAAAPGGISSQSLVDDFGLNPQEKQALQDYYNRRYGLDQPAPLQYLRWLNNISPIGFQLEDDGNFGEFSFTKGTDLGESFRYGRPVREILEERVPITLLLNVLTIPLVYLISILVGVHAARDRGGRFDISSSIVMLALWSIPTMLTGVLLIGFFASEQHWHWFPPSGLSDREALDMPFLPHWNSTLDILKLFLGLIVGTWLGVIAARIRQISVRRLIAVITALTLTAVMLNDLSYSPGYWVYLVTGIILLGIFYPVAVSYSELLRVILFGLAGMLLGAIAGLSSGEDVFVRGFLLDRLWHLMLPIICLAYGSFAFLSRLTRSAVLENLQADYARTARAKGVDENRVLWSHVFRNSLLPLITVFASLLPGLLGGSVIVESLFSIDGMGKLALEAVTGRDRELVLSITLIGGVLTLAGNLLADILYAAVDPRVSYD